MSALLDVHGLTAGYDKLLVVDGADLRVKEGEAIGIVGRNGSGKTTLLKATMGLLPPRSGSIHVLGTEITRKGPWTRSPLGIAYVPQGRLIFPRLSVEDNLALGATASSRPVKESLTSVYDVFPVLAKIRDRRAGTLSGGQQQILAIGRALMSRPRLIIFDEPTEGIQPSIILEIAETLGHLRKEWGVSLLVVEQRLDFLRRVVDDAYIMDRGRLVERLPILDLATDVDLHRKYLGV